MARQPLSGTQTRRGVGVTRTVSCQMQAAWSNEFGSGPTYEVPAPFPFSVPGRRLRTRKALYIKYFSPDHGTIGTFYLIEAQAPGQVSQRGYPIRNNAFPETRRQKRLKQVLLPITGLTRVFSGNPAAEPGSSLEFG